MKKIEDKPKSRLKPILLTKKYSEELAEFIGIMLGDGNIKLPKKGDRGYRIRICGNSETDRDYLLNYVNPLSIKLFGVEFSIYYHPCSKAIYLTKSNKHLYYTLLHFGLKPGNKKINSVSIPNWIFSNKKYIKACIRGLLDTDGSVSKHKNRNYTLIWFKSAIPNLRKDFSNSMDILGYRIAKWTGQTDTLQTCIAARGMLRKYKEEIGFSNPKHERKFMI